jgi:hypothetical protein
VGSGIVAPTSGIVVGMSETVEATSGTVPPRGIVPPIGSVVSGPAPGPVVVGRVPSLPALMIDSPEAHPVATANVTAARARRRAVEIREFIL